MADNARLTRITGLPRPFKFKSIEDATKAQEELYRALSEWRVDIPRPNQLMSGLFIRPEWYGAVGDGVTDDTAAIQAAADAVNAAGGGVIIFGPNTYIGNFKVGSDTTLQGSGIRQTILKAAAGSNAAVVEGKNFAALTGKAYAVGDTGRGDNNVCIYDLTIDGNKANQTTAGYGVRLWGISHSWANVFIQSCKEGGVWTEFTTIDGGTTADMLEGHFLNIHTNNNDGDGWVFTGPHDSVITNYVTAANGGWGWRSVGGASSIKGSHWNSWMNTTGSYYFASTPTIDDLNAGDDYAGTGIEFAAGLGSALITNATIASSETGIIIRGSDHFIQAHFLNNRNVADDDGDAIVLDGSINCQIHLVASGNNNLIRIVSEAGRSYIQGIASIAAGKTVWDPSGPPTSDYVNLILYGAGAPATIQQVNYPSLNGFKFGGWSPSFPASDDTLVAQEKTWTSGLSYPSSGTWAVGDVCINTAPIPGSNFGWVCTSAGTPGTWTGIEGIAGGVPVLTTIELTDLTDGVIPYNRGLSEISEIVANGEFSSDATSWVAGNGTLASVAGGQSGNCLEITRTSGSYQSAYQNLSGLTIGKTYVCSAYVKSGTSGNEAFDFRYYDGDSIGTANSSGTSSGSWVQYSFRFTATTTTAQIGVYKMTDTTGTMLFDTVSIKEAPGLSDSPLSTDGTDVDNSGVYKVDGTQVVSNRVVDADFSKTPNSGDADTDTLIDKIRDALITHGLIASS